MRIQEGQIRTTEPVRFGIINQADSVHALPETVDKIALPHHDGSLTYIMALQIRKEGPKLIIEVLRRLEHALPVNSNMRDMLEGMRRWLGDQRSRNGTRERLGPEGAELSRLLGWFYVDGNSGFVE